MNDRDHSLEEGAANAYETPLLQRLGNLEQLTEAKPDARGKSGKGRDGGRKPRTKFLKPPGKLRKRKWWEKEKPEEDDKGKKKGFLR